MRFQGGAASPARREKLQQKARDMLNNPSTFLNQGQVVLKFKARKISPVTSDVDLYSWTSLSSFFLTMFRWILEFRDFQPPASDEVRERARHILEDAFQNGATYRIQPDGNLLTESLFSAVIQ